MGAANVVLLSTNMTMTEVAGRRPRPPDAIHVDNRYLPTLSSRVSSESEEEEEREDCL